MISEGDHVLVDGNEGAAFVRPTGSIEEAFEAKLAATQKQRAEFAAFKSLESITTDGERLTVAINAGLRDDVEALDLTGADAIGLFRTEFQFLVSATLPRREAQLGSTRRCSRPPATSWSCSAPSTSAATRRCPICVPTVTRRRIRRWAGGRCACRSTAAR